MHPKNKAKHKQLNLVKFTTGRCMPAPSSAPMFTIQLLYTQLVCAGLMQKIVCLTIAIGSLALTHCTFLL